MFKSKTITLNGVSFDVPVSENDTISGAELARTMAVEPDATLVRDTDSGYQVVNPKDQIKVDGGDQFASVARFRAAGRDVARINRELEGLMQYYGRDGVLWPESLSWVIILNFKMPARWSKPDTKLAVVIPDNYGYGAPLKDCFVDPALRYQHEGTWEKIDHYFDTTSGPTFHPGFQSKDWRYLCVHLEPWKPGHGFAAYLKAVFAFLSNPKHPWLGN